MDLKELQSGGLSQNVPLQGRRHDLRAGRRDRLRVRPGEEPGAYPLRTKNTTVLQALALAGGVTDRGSTGRIKIVRIVNGKKTEIKVGLTDLIQPGDTIMVPERYF